MPRPSLNRACAELFAALTVTWAVSLGTDLPRPWSSLAWLALPLGIAAVGWAAWRCEHARR